jgi:hypothetical protein
VMVNISTNINKTKESLNSDGEHFHQYQQNKRKFKQWWWTTFFHNFCKKLTTLTIWSPHPGPILSKNELASALTRPFFFFTSFRWKVKDNG